MVDSAQASDDNGDRRVCNNAPHPLVVARIVAILTPVHRSSAVPPVFPDLAVLPAIPPVLATIPSVFNAIPARSVLSLRRHWVDADERCQKQCGACRSDAVHLDLPSKGCD